MRTLQLTSKIDGRYDTISVENLTVQAANNYQLNREVIIPYGTEFYNAQDVSQFIASYGAYLSGQGVLFDQIESGLQVSWGQMIAEFLYWAQSGWQVGSIVNINLLLILSQSIKKAQSYNH